MLKLLKRIFPSGAKTSKRNNSLNISASISINNEINPARELLKEATQLKHDKKFDEACEKLKEAYSAKGADELMVKERLRLPMYLQLAGKNDEGWKILNEINITFIDVFSQAEIANQMRVFLQKEKKHKQAIMFGAWCICKEIERDRSNIESCINMTDEMAKLSSELDFLGGNNEKEEVFAHTPSGNPITDSAYKMFIDRIEYSISLEGIKERLAPMFKRAKLESDLDRVSSKFSDYLKSCNKYDLSEVRDIIYNNAAP